MVTDEKKKQTPPNLNVLRSQEILCEFANRLVRREIKRALDAYLAFDRFAVIEWVQEHFLELGFSENDSS